MAVLGSTTIPTSFAHTYHGGSAYNRWFKFSVSSVPWAGETGKCYKVTGISVLVAADPNYTGSLEWCSASLKVTDAGGSHTIGAGQGISFECADYDAGEGINQGTWIYTPITPSDIVSGAVTLLEFTVTVPDTEPTFNYYPVWHGVRSGVSTCIIIYGYEVDCESGEPLLTVITLEATDIAESEGVVTATINGEITATGGENADERGFDYGLTDSYGNSWTEEGDFGIGIFNHVLTELLPYTTYHFRAKAHNSGGWVYGEDFSFGYYPSAGYLWVEGVTLCYTAMDEAKRAITGTNIGGSHTPGHIWIEGHYLHYIDQSGAERWIDCALQGGSFPAKAPGYIWIEETLIHFIDSTGNERYAVL